MDIGPGNRSARVGDSRGGVRRGAAFDGCVMTVPVCSMPYPARALSGAHRVEQWIDAYWRTGDLILDGFDGAILKLTEGGPGYFEKNNRREWVEKQIGRVVNRGLGLQFYHYGRPDSVASGKNIPGDARAEAQTLLDAIDALGVDPMALHYQDGSTAAVWLDLESPAPNLSGGDGLAWIDSFCDVVESRFPVGLYTDDSWLTDHVTGDRWMETGRVFTRSDESFRPIWVARYGDSPKMYPPNLNKWPHWVKVPNWYLCRRGSPPVVQWTSSRVGGTEDGRGHDSNLVYLA